MSITFTNDGPDSFKHESYGDEITVVRKINSSGQGHTYQLKNQWGKDFISFLMSFAICLAVVLVIDNLFL